MALTIDQLRSIPRMRFGDDLSSEDPYFGVYAGTMADPNSSIPGEQAQLANLVRGGTFTAENIAKLERAYGIPLRTDADIQRLMAAINADLAGKAPGSPDRTGIFQVPTTDRLTDMAKLGTMIGVGAIAGGTLFGAGGLLGSPVSAAPVAEAATAVDSGFFPEILNQSYANPATGNVLGGATSNFLPPVSADPLSTASTFGGVNAPAFGGAPQIYANPGTAAALGGATSEFLPAVSTELPSLTSVFGNTPVGMGANLTEAGLSSGLPGFINDGFSSLGAIGGASDLFGNLGGSVDSLTNQLKGGRDWLGTGLALAPALAAIAYARNQDPFDTSRLRADYAAIDPNALALPYDLQTAKGRVALNSSLTDRNVMGSSFGNQDLASYDMLRHAGRQNILTSGVATRAGIANNILDAEVKERMIKNDLYGRALLALSNGLNPPQTNINIGGAPKTTTNTNDIAKLLGLGGSISSLFR